MIQVSLSCLLNFSFKKNVKFVWDTPILEQNYFDMCSNPVEKLINYPEAYQSSTFYPRMFLNDWSVLCILSYKQFKWKL